MLGIFHQISTLHPTAQVAAVIGVALFCCIGLYFVGRILHHIYTS